MTFGYDEDFLHPHRTDNNRYSIAEYDPKCVVTKFGLSGLNSAESKVTSLAVMCISRENFAIIYLSKIRAVLTYARACEIRINC